MAISKNPNLDGFSGHIDRTVVIRQDQWGRTILSAFPDMSNIKPSEGQKAQRLSFKEAQTVALKMLKDPSVKAFYKSLCQNRQRPHNILISELLKKQKSDNPVNER
ncbi:hypothetical protein [Daejeonella sp.]|uniref:hypothetical protein n=1 Tax=Daejeonella sp. TaxID=2805397 RepID=UPI0039835CF8